MLLSYSISNFKSIKCTNKISFFASPLKKENGRKLINILDIDILPVVGVFGPNGGGKSSIIESITFLTQFLFSRNDVFLLDKLFKKLNVLKNSIWKDRPTTWCVEFLSKDQMFYKYEVSISNEKIESELLFKRKNLRNEWKLIFDRKNNKFSNEILQKKVKIDDLINGNMLYHLNSILDDVDISNVVNQFQNIRCVSNNINDLNFDYHKTPLDFNFLIKMKKNFLKIFDEIDLNIIDIKQDVEIDGNRKLFLKKRNEYGDFWLEFRFESEGTQKIIELIVLFVKFCNNDTVFVIDEIDCKLHTKLLGYIIDLFNSENVNYSQLLFTSHDMNTLDKKYLRKDEVYFAALNELYYTNIVCLNDFKFLRNTMSFNKNYLDGKIGFDPYVKKAEKWE